MSSGILPSELPFCHPSKFSLKEYKCSQLPAATTMAFKFCISTAQSPALCCLRQVCWCCVSVMSHVQACQLATTLGRERHGLLPQHSRPHWLLYRLQATAHAAVTLVVQLEWKPWQEGLKALEPLSTLKALQLIVIATGMNSAVCQLRSSRKVH